MAPRFAGDGIIDCHKFTSSPALYGGPDVRRLVYVCVVELAGGQFDVWVQGVRGAFVFHGESKIAALTTFANVAMLEDVRPEALKAMGFESFIGSLESGRRHA